MIQVGPLRIEFLHSKHDTGGGLDMFRFFVHADQPGALVGVNINGSSAGFAKVDEHVAGYYQDGVGVLAKAGDTIRVWMYSPATPGSVLIDDASLVIDTGPR